MVALLFWNIAKNPASFDSIVRLAYKESIDVLFLAEFPGDEGDIDGLVVRLNDAKTEGSASYRVADRRLTKMRAIARISESDFFPHYSNPSRDLTIWNLTFGNADLNSLRVAVVHLPSKMGGMTPSAQAAVAAAIVGQIRWYEERERCENTIVMGDFNMNPYEDGMVLVPGFHGSMTQELATKERNWREEDYLRFYNPMWGFFGDRTPGPPGTYYWKSSVPEQPPLADVRSSLAPARGHESARRRADSRNRWREFVDKWGRNSYERTHLGSSADLVQTQSLNRPGGACDGRGRSRLLARWIDDRRPIAVHNLDRPGH